MEDYTYKGHYGYNNGVTLIDNICNSCYKNSNYSGMIARNLKLEDIGEATELSYGSSTYRSLNTSSLPYIWVNNEQNDEIELQSKAYELTTKTTVSGGFYTYSRTTSWSLKYSGRSTQWTNPIYFDMTIGTNSSDKNGYSAYWLSTRRVNYNGSAGNQYRVI